MGAYIGKVNGIDISKDVMLDSTKTRQGCNPCYDAKEYRNSACRSGEQKWAGICRIDEVYFATTINVFRQVMLRLVYDFCIFSFICIVKFFTYLTVKNFKEYGWQSVESTKLW